MQLPSRWYGRRVLTVGNGDHEGVDALVSHSRFGLGGPHVVLPNFSGIGYPIPDHGAPRRPATIGTDVTEA